MPQVPTATNDVEVKPLPSGGYQAADFGAGIGPGLKAVGQDIGQAADTIHQANAQIDEGAYKQQMTGYIGGRDGILHSGPDPFLSKSGGDALAARQQTEQSLRDLAANTINAAKSPFQRKLLSVGINAQLTNDLNTVGEHVAQQSKQYNLDNTVGLKEAATNTAALHFADPVASEHDVATAGQEAENASRLKGEPDSLVAAQRQVAVSNARTAIIKNLSMSGPQGPATAASYFDKFKSDFTAKDMEEAQTYITAHQDHYEADARRQAAEAREADNRAKAQARQNAEYFIQVGNLASQPPEVVAAGLQAAKDSGDPTMLFRAGQVAQKQKTMTEYGSFTPSELQPHINELAAKVKNDGNHADIADVLKLNTLNEMYKKTDSEIKSDQWGWAAQHMGITQPQINWNDPNSVHNLLNTAHMIAARTGYPPQYLPSAVAAQMAPILATGTAEEKAGLIQRIAKLGPTAGTAAMRQIAPNDPAAQGLVGLASIPNQSVAHALVSYTLQGPEALKSAPKLFNQNYATIDPQYQQFAAALSLMPEVRAGAFENAKNYFAGKQAVSGHTDFMNTNFSQEWPAALNSALGAYMDNGVMRGGMATHNGATTILPDGWSQADFETRIARMTPEQFNNASHSHPIWSDGRNMTLGELKRAQLFPIAGGYAVALNGQFAKSKEKHSFYVLDLSALR